MSSEAKKVITYLYGAGVSTKWPESDGFNRSDVENVLDIYHDLVANKGFALPNTPENIKKLTAAIRSVLGIASAQAPGGLMPANVLLTLTKKVKTDMDPALYQWVYPNQIKYTPAPTFTEKYLPTVSPSNPISTTISDVKWILITGGLLYVLMQTGLLKKVFK